jgi:PST family polysaccharide transporter
MFFNGTVIKAAGKPSWQFGITLLNAVCSVIGFLVAVQGGIVAVAASFVIVGYSLAPISFLAVRRLIQVDFGAYLRQFVPPLFASLMMVVVIMGLKYLLREQSLNIYLELAIYMLAGGLTYLLVIGLMARSLYYQILELVRLALPGRKLRKTVRKTT